MGNKTHHLLEIAYYAELHAMDQMEALANATTAMAPYMEKYDKDGMPRFNAYTQDDLDLCLQYTLEFYELTEAGGGTP